MIWKHVLNLNIHWYHFCLLISLPPFWRYGHSYGVSNPRLYSTPQKGRVFKVQTDLWLLCGILVPTSPQPPHGWKTVARTPTVYFPHYPLGCVKFSKACRRSPNLTGLPKVACILQGRGNGMQFSRCIHNLFCCCHHYTAEISKKTCKYIFTRLIGVLWGYEKLLILLDFLTFYLSVTSTHWPEFSRPNFIQT